MLEIPVDFYSTHNSWTPKFCTQVAHEYERFLELRAENENLSPPDNVDKFWHTHILNSKSYISYCFKKFNKYIHHSLIDSLDQSARVTRLANTVQSYKNKFGSFTYPNVWNQETDKKINDCGIPANFKPNEKVNNISKSNNLKLNLPSYQSIKTLNSKDPDVLNILITYRPGNIFSSINLPLDNKILQVKINKNTTFTELKQLIMKKTGMNNLIEKYKPIAINLDPHPEYKPGPKPAPKRSWGLMEEIVTSNSNYFSYEDDGFINRDVIYNSLFPDCKFYIADIHEMTQAGYC